MIRPSRAPRPTLMVSSLACVALMALIASPVAAAAGGTGTVTTTAATTPTATYTPATLAEFHQKLDAGQIQTVTVNKRLRSLRVTLKDGQRLLVHYAPHEEPTIASEMLAKHVAVIVLTPTAAVAEEKGKPVHHKLRYVAGGILLVVIIVVGAVLLVNRRRRAASDY